MLARTGVFSSSPRAPWDSRYSMVDAWRGLAALGVVFYHLGLSFQFDLGHASVMVFFVISGYCIAASAESCKRNNVGPGGYMWRRVRRIYPPYFFSLCFFLATRLMKMQAGLGETLSYPAVLWIQNLTMTQWFTLLRHPLPYAYYNRSLLIAGYWSLNYEEQFYIVMGLILFAAVYFRKAMLPGIAILMLPAFLWNITHPAISNGFFLEYWIAFAMGCLVFYRLCRTGSLAGRLAIDATLIFFLVLSLYEGGLVRHGPRWVYSEWIVTTLFALVLIYCRPLDRIFKESKVGVALCGFSLITYSLYLTHQCVLRASSIVASWFIRLGLPRFTEFPIRVLVVCAVGAIFWYFCERPFLNKPLPNRPRSNLDEAATAVAMPATQP